MPTILTKTDGDAQQSIFQEGRSHSDPFFSGSCWRDLLWDLLMGGFFPLPTQEPAVGGHFWWL